MHIRLIMGCRDGVIDETKLESRSNVQVPLLNRSANPNPSFGVLRYHTSEALVHII